MLKGAGAWDARRGVADPVDDVLWRAEGVCSSARLAEKSLLSSDGVRRCKELAGPEGVVTFPAMDDRGARRALAEEVRRRAELVTEDAAA